MKVILSPEAVDDLAAIARWIATDNPKRAGTFVEELQSVCATLARRPSRFPVALTVAGHAIRKRVHRGYLIFYRGMENRVEIVRVVHGARDWADLLSEIDLRTAT